MYGMPFSKKMESTETERRSSVLKRQLENSGKREGIGKGSESNLSIVQEKEASYESERKIKESSCRSTGNWNCVRETYMMEEDPVWLGQEENWNEEVDDGQENGNFVVCQEENGIQVNKTAATFLKSSDDD